MDAPEADRDRYTDTRRSRREALGDDDPISRTDDAPPPISPAARFFRATIALIFIAVIVVFLVWFIATHTERTEGGSFFGQIDVVPEGVAGEAIG